MKNKLALIVPYVGTLPRNFDLYMESCRLNKEIDWYLFLDVNSDVSSFEASNVHVIEMTFDEMKNRLCQAIGKKEIALSSAYKLCDYKPVYGLAFQDFVNQYEFWGYTDVDIIYGRLYKYLGAYLDDNSVDKIGSLGHLTCFRNKTSINSAFLESYSLNGSVDCWFLKNVIKSDEVFHFDEMGGINQIFEKLHLNVISSEKFGADILLENVDIISNDTDVKTRKSLFVYYKGKLSLFYLKKGQICIKEYAYLHLQKRRNFSNFLTAPIHVERPIAINSLGYYYLTMLDEGSILKEIHKNKVPIFERIIYLWKSLKGMGHHFLPYRYIIWRIIHEKNFYI